MRIKRRIILFTQLFFILTLFVVINTSKFDPATIPLSSDTNIKSFTLNTDASWSNATVISDDFTGWNDGTSGSPKIAKDNNGNLHVVWMDYTDGGWGTDAEIWYVNYTASGWSKATCISDLYGWNNGESYSPSLTVDSIGNVHVVWEDDTDGAWGTDYEIFYANYTVTGWSNAIAISDLYGWNDDDSHVSRIAVDYNGNLHVVWQDDTDGEWGTDREIMYTNYTTSGWSNATCVSDAYGWNNGDSRYPNVAADDSGNVHVVWTDYTDGEWGTDIEIMYANYTTSGWSNATCISDLYGWNNGESYSPSLTVDGIGNVHVVWMDNTNGEWGTDWEIMYVNYTTFGWSNATVISDDYTGWNDGESNGQSIAVDGSGNVHVVWYDDTNGEWGTDWEIMYANYTAAGWSNATIISDIYGWNNGGSVSPNILAEDNGNLHLVWGDNTVGEWGGGGLDYEIMYAIITERPTTTHPTDTTIVTSSSVAFYWTLYDETGPGQYRVWVNDANDNYYIWQNWTPWINNSPIFVPINSTVPGRFNYTIEYYDFYQQFGISDSVIVTIIDPAGEEPIIIAPQGGGDISRFLLSPLGLGIIAGVGAILLILVAVVINNKKTIKELKKTSKTTTSKKSN